jgi:hypothetical protein
VDNIKIDLRERGRDVMDWIDLAQDRDQWKALVNTVMNLPVPYVNITLYEEQVVYILAVFFLSKQQEFFHQIWRNSPRHEVYENS